MFLHSWNYKTNYTNWKKGWQAVTLEGWPLVFCWSLGLWLVLEKQMKILLQDYNLKEKLIRQPLFDLHSSTCNDSNSLTL